MSQNVTAGLREWKRRATHERIIAEVARLVAGQGLASTTVDQIAAAADVGRATSFRYFDTKERAVADGGQGDLPAVIDQGLRSVGPTQRTRDGCSG